MCQLNNTYVETMCASNGCIKLMDYHNDRLNTALQAGAGPESGDQ